MTKNPKTRLVLLVQQKSGISQEIEKKVERACYWHKKIIRKAKVM